MQVRQLPKRPQRQVSNSKKGPLKAEGRLSRRISVAIIFVATFITYAATLGNWFVYDDHSQILNNVWIRDIAYIPNILTTSGTGFLNSAANTYRPMLHLLFMAEYHLFGLQAWGYHLVNVLIHSVNASLVFLIALELFKAPKTPPSSLPLKGSVVTFPSGRQFSNIAPFFAGLFFALNPVNTEVVSWVSAVPELTFMFFLLASLFLYLKASQADERTRGFFIILSAFSFFLALLGKETAMSLPVLVFAYDLSTLGKGVFKNWRRYAVFTGVAFFYMAVRTIVIGGVIHHKQIDLSAYEALLNAFPLFLDYVWKLILPVNLNALYEFYAVTSVTEPTVIGGVLAAVVLIVTAFFVRREKVLFVGIFMVGVPLLPVLYVPALSAAAFADRYMYLPSAGFALILSYFFHCGIKGACGPDKPQAHASRLKGKIVIVAGLVICLLYAAGSIKRSVVWKDDYTLWSDTVKKSPNSPNVHYNLAWAMQKKGMVKEAEARYIEVLRLDPASYDAHYNLGVLYLDTLRLDEAEGEFEQALRIKPDAQEIKRLKELLKVLRLQQDPA